MAQRDFGPTSDLGPIGQSVHTETYNPAPNNNQCDMGVVHSYRFVNTEGMYGMLSGDKSYTVDVGDYPLDFYLDFCPRQEDPEGTTNYFYNNVNIHFTNINEGPTVHTETFDVSGNPNEAAVSMGDYHRYKFVNTLGLYAPNDFSIRTLTSTVADLGDLLVTLGGSATEYESGWASPLIGDNEFSNRIKMRLYNMPLLRSASTETLSEAKTYSAGFYPYPWTVTPATISYDVTTASMGDVVSGYTFYKKADGVALTKYSGTLNKFANYMFDDEAYLGEDRAWVYLKGRTSYTNGVGTSKSIQSTNFVGLHYGYVGAVTDRTYVVMGNAKQLGNATPAQVLSTASFTSDNSGSLANVGTISTQSASSTTIESATTYPAGYYPSSWTITPRTLHTTKKTFDSYTYANNSSIDLGDYHTFKTISTVGLYNRYVKDGSYQQYLHEIDVGALSEAGYTGRYTGLISTLQSDKNFYYAFNVYTYNIPSGPTVHTTKKTLSSYSYGNNSTIDLGDYHSIKTISTSGYLYYKYTAAASKPTIDVGRITSGTSTTGYTDNISTLMAGGNNFYSNVNIYLSNVPKYTETVHTTTKYINDSYIYGNNPSIDMTATHSYRYISTSGMLYYMYAASRYQPTIDVGRLASGGSTAYTGPYDTRQSGNNFYKEVNMFLSNIPIATSFPSSVLDEQAFPLLLSVTKAASSGWNNQVVYPNSTSSRAWVGFPGTKYAGSLGPFYYSTTNKIFNFLNDSSTILTDSNSMFDTYVINSSRGTAALVIKYDGWYKIELTAYKASNPQSIFNNAASIYRFSSGSAIPANENYAYNGTEILRVYGNALYDINNKPSNSNTLTSSGNGYGFQYAYLQYGNCLVGRVPGLSDTTLVTEFRIGLVYNSALKILR